VATVRRPWEREGGKDTLRAARWKASWAARAFVLVLRSCAATLRQAALATGGRLLTVEDHWPEGGVGEAVATVFTEDAQPPRLVRLAVHELPGSGTPAELLAAAGIDATAIANAARRLAIEARGKSRHAA